MVGGSVKFMKVQSFEGDYEMEWWRILLRGGWVAGGGGEMKLQSSRSTRVE